MFFCEHDLSAQSIFGMIFRCEIMPHRSSRGGNSDAILYLAGFEKVMWKSAVFCFQVGLVPSMPSLCSDLHHEVEVCHRV